MPTLQIRDLPEHLHNRLKEEAGKQHRSLSQQAVVALSKGIGKPLDAKARRKQLLERICSAPAHGFPGQLKDPVELIRRDRER